MTDCPPTIATPTAPPAESGDELQAAGQTADGARRVRWNSTELLGDRTEVFIDHGAEIYRLRRTRQGKLILYK
jgi:hemin uptake protein HemP